MKIFSLDKMIKGWFIGNFVPSCFKTDLFEVAMKKYQKGDHESKHFHKVASEYT